MATYDYSQIMYGMILVFLLFVPIMMMMAFNYINKRNGCDFYHAIPVKRNSLYISSMLAVLLWTVIIILGGAATSIGVFSCSSYIAIEGSSWMFLLSILAGAVLVMGAFSIGIATTGTTFTNIVVSGMILLVPRIFIYVVVQMISQYIPFVYFGTGFAGLDYNMVVGTLTQIFMGNGLPAFDIISFAYSTILGLIYAVIGCLAFCKRRSESASMASISNVLQCIFRLIPSAFISLLATATVVRYIFQSDDYSESELLLIIIIYVVAVIAYFLYELITTRKWSRVVKSIKQLPILIGINIIVAAGMVGIHYDAVNNIPDADDINYIEVESIGRQNYLFNMLGKSQLSSDKAKELVSDVLKEEIGVYCDDYSRYNSEYVYSYQETDVAINTNRGTIRRRIYLNTTQLNTLVSEMTNAAKIESLSDVLPQYGDKGYTFESYDFSLDISELKQIYESVIEEIGTVEKLMNYTDSSYKYALCSIQLYRNDGGYVLSLPVNELTPNTAKLVYSLINGRTEKGIDELCNATQDDSTVINGNFMMADGSYYSFNRDADMDGELFVEPEDWAEIKDILERSSDTDINIGENVIYLWYSLSNDNDGSYSSSEHFYELSNDDYEELLKLLYIKY